MSRELLTSKQLALRSAEESLLVVGVDLSNHWQEAVLKHLLPGQLAEIQVNELLGSQDSQYFVAKLLNRLMSHIGTMANKVSSPVDIAITNEAEAVDNTHPLLAPEAAIESLESQIQITDRLTVVLNGFESVYSTDKYREIEVDLSTLIDTSRKLRFVLVVDVSQVDKHHIENSPLVRSCRLINLGEKLSPADTEKLIDELLDFSVEDGVDLMMEFTGRIEPLISLLCSEMKEMHDTDPHQAIALRKMDSFVSDAGTQVISARAAKLFERWWEGLSNSGQLAILIMRQISPELRACHANKLRQEISKYAHTSVDVTEILDNLVFKGFLDVTNSGYELASGLHVHWLQHYLKRRNATSEIVTRLILLAKNPTSFDRHVLDNLLSIEERVESSTLSYLTTHGPVILHISDTQFGTAHAFNNSALTGYGSIVDSITQDMRHNYESGRIPIPNVIVVSGDIANAGLPNEFTKGSDFISSLIAEMNEAFKPSPPLVRDDVVIVPGNHDVNWDLSKLAPDSPDEHREQLSRYRFSPFVDFFNRFYDYHRFYSADPGADFSVYDYSDRLGTLIVGFNSCSEEDHEQHHGFVTVDSIRNAEKRIQQLIDQGEIRHENIKAKIAVWHHDIRIGGQGSDHLVNANEVMGALKDANFNCVLHGHLHALNQSSISSHTNPSHNIKVFGAGSIGVETKERAGDIKRGQFPLSYNIVAIDLDVRPHRIRIYVREGNVHGDKVFYQPWAGWEGGRTYYEADL